MEANTYNWKRQDLYVCMRKRERYLEIERQRIKEMDFPSGWVKCLTTGSLREEVWFCGVY